MDDPTLGPRIAQTIYVSLIFGVLLAWWLLRPSAPRDDRPRPRRTAPADDPRMAQAAPAPRYAAYYQQQQPAPPLVDWFRAFNEMPDVNPHVAVCGPSGSGKSTLVLAALHQRPGQLVICTPKNVVDDPWGGFPCARLTFDAEGVHWDEINAAVSLVYDEWLRRNADGSAPRTPLTLVIDEYATVIDKLPTARNRATGREIPGVKDKVLDLWSMGRSVGIRVVTLGTEVNVKAWGIEGRGDIRGNLLFIETAPDKSAVMYRWGGERQAIETRHIRQLAVGLLDPARLWLPPEGGIRGGIGGGSDTGIGGTAGIPGSSASISAEMDAEPVGELVPVPVFDPESATDVERYQEAMRLAADTKISANEIVRRVGGNRNNVLAAVRLVRGES
jgi:energy-coupling factor transporter ATP-binding protein EcfA2